MFFIRSQEIRDIFFNMYNLGCKIKEISNYLSVSISTLYRWIKEGPLIHKRSKRTLKLEEYKEKIINYIEKNNTCTLADIKEFINTQMCISTIFNYLRIINISFKKGSKNYSESDPLKTEEFMNNIKLINKDDIMFLDEASFVMNHSRMYGRSLKGSRLNIILPGRRGKRYSLLLCISNEKVINYKLYEGSVTAVLFKDFIQELPSNKTLIMDNASIHKATNNLKTKGFKSIKETCNDNKINILYLPPYKPQLTPVELCFNTIRSYVNKLRPRTIEELTPHLIHSINSLNNYCSKIISKIFTKK